MSITIKELAAVSRRFRGTVDRALNGRGGVAAEVEKRILKLAKEHHYVPNRAGKALATRKKPFLVGVTMPSIGNPFFHQVRQGIQTAAKELADYGMEVRLVETKGLEGNTQLEAIHLLEQEGIQALALAAINEKGVIAAIDRLCEEGIPVATFNADVEGSKRAFYVGSDYTSSGRVAGELMGLFTGGKASVGVVTGSTQMLGHTQRIAGFQAVGRERFPLLSLCGTQQCLDDEKMGYQAVKRLLSLYPEMDALYLTGGGVSGCCKAVEESGKRLTVIAFDAVSSTQEYMRKGIIQAVVCQQPFSQGQRTIQLLADWFFSGKPPKKRIYYMENQIRIRENIGEISGVE